jgi:flagellar FliJ protein
MKKRSERLALVADLAERRKKEAEKFLADQIKRVESDAVQLSQLEQYLTEYQGLYQQAMLQGMMGPQIMNYQAFMTKIADTIEQHKKAMKVNQEQLVQVKRYWAQMHGRHSALESLADKALDAEHQKADKALQKQMDERSQQVSSML